ncbi:hypothetical protein FOCC_FOCC008590 [Frankliniella occidentalis]|uniref:Uncharacterized protein LOC113212038 n=1 Tax=Frankliniella occidentalis TaxID=133901 RepID=A0A6J1SZM9_FRAOC|nr:uncharacterized protein LOC113212038 [Frankliniella occidentalis]KAE8744773.1 hypothetical protein FOCC_FOCC008590 [Frankliniella occidentalis]
MSSLVADYGSSSSGSEDESESDHEASPRHELSSPTAKVPLPRPDFANGPTSKNSVFLNPYVEAEIAKKAILEKHVKMVPSKDEVRFINGKQICWNYRKGRCRFGHNCKFAHDSDLHQGGSQSSSFAGNVSGQIVPDGGSVSPEPEADEGEEGQMKRKKRPGLSQTLVPGKKVLNRYKKQRVKETPWKS